MDIKLMLTSFGLVFLAELGDKTQLAAFCLASENCYSKLSVFSGAATALLISSLIAVFLGDTISRYIPQNYIKIGVGVLFILTGIWTLFSAITSQPTSC